MEYTPHNWTTGETVTSNKLNHMEEGISDAAREINELEALNPFAGEVDVTDAERNQALANVSNQAANSTTGKMGYKVLDPSKTFAEQVTEANTIYEIRNYFDLANSTIFLPENSVLRFVGGLLDNGCLVGNNSSIQASCQRIFGNNIALSQFCFAGKDNSGANIYTYLPWIDLEDKKVSVSGTTRKWKITTSGQLSNSDADGQGVFSEIVSGENDYLILGKEMLLVDAPGSFKAVNTDTNLNTLQWFTGNYLVLATFFKEDDGTFIVPNRDRIVFFSSNNASDNPNITKIAPGTVIDLSETTIYATYLEAPMLAANSTWRCEAELGWFLSSFTMEKNGFANLTDESRGIQNALDCPMDVRSSIIGIIRCDKPLYAERRKKIVLGSVIDYTSELWEDNSKGRSVLTYGATLICCNNDINLFYVRNTIELTGGAFSAEFAETHTKSILIFDGTYKSSYCTIKTSIRGKVTNGVPTTFYGINADYTDKENGGYNSFSTIHCYIKNCKYSLFAKHARSTSYINSVDLNLVCFAYFEAIRIESAFDASRIKAYLQDSPCVPISEVDDHPHAYIYSDRSVIDIIQWDWSHSKTTAQIQKPYLPPVILGTNTSLFGSADAANNPLKIRGYREPGFAGFDPFITIGNSALTSFRHPVLGNVLSATTCWSTSMAGNILSSAKLVKYKLPESFDLDSYDGKSEDITGIISENVDTSVSTNIALFSVAAVYPHAASLNVGEYLEIYLETKSGLYFDAANSWKEFGLAFNTIKNPWACAKLIVWDSSNNTKIGKVVFDGNKSYGFGSFGSDIRKVNKICLRCYGRPENSFGVAEPVSNAQVFPHLLGWGLNNNTAYFDSNYQRLIRVPTPQRPTENLYPGMSMFDSTLGKPIWLKSVVSGVGTWVDATGATV